MERVRGAEPRAARGGRTGGSPRGFREEVHQLGTVAHALADRAPGQEESRPRGEVLMPVGNAQPCPRERVSLTHSRNARRMLVSSLSPSRNIWTKRCRSDRLSMGKARLRGSGW